jgi:hypothetical protein
MTCPPHPPWLVHSNYTWRRVLIFSRSQGPYSLRHEPSSRSRTLKLWFRIPLEALMSVCRQRPCGGLIPVQSVLLTKYTRRWIKWNSGQGPQRV